MTENAQSMAALLAKVAPAAILNNDYTSLISYIKSAGSNENVVYAMYFKTNGKPYVRYIDKKKEKIKGYINTGESNLNNRSDEFFNGLVKKSHHANR